MSTQSFDNFDPDDDGPSSGGKLVRKDFDCPDCDANNPYDDGISAGDEVRCFYCGLEFKVEVTSEGKWKFREL